MLDSEAQDSGTTRVKYLKPPLSHLKAVRQARKRIEALDDGFGPEAEDARGGKVSARCPGLAAQLPQADLDERYVLLVISECEPLKQGRLCCCCWL